MNETCRLCGCRLQHLCADLGMAPLANSYRTAAELGQGEMFYPLRVYVCHRCWLVQLPQFVTPEVIFRHYLYFSSYSESWLRHAQTYVERMTGRFELGPHTQVVEIASNDGYLLRYFRQKGIPILGIEPAENIAEVARAAGIPTLTQFFGSQTAAELVAGGTRAALLVANNVLAHVPDLNDFIRGMKCLLAPRGILTLEFHHLLHLITQNQFDTIYHEHFSYLSLLSVEPALAAHGLEVFDVEELASQGGSLRVYARHAAEHRPAVTPAVAQLRERERQAGLDCLETYGSFAERVCRAKRELLEFLLGVRAAGEHVVAYGAAAKGTTLLNCCGLRGDSIDYVVDRSPQKQGRFLPGSHIPIYAPEKVRETRPDWLLVLPWNLKQEIMKQMAHVAEWGCRFLIPIPKLEILPCNSRRAA